MHSQRQGLRAYCTCCSDRARDDVSKIAAIVTAGSLLTSLLVSAISRKASCCFAIILICEVR